MDGKFLTMVRNFKSEQGWESVGLSSDDIKQIQENLREFNKDVLEDSLRDAGELLARYPSIYERRPDGMCQLAMFLASKRILDVRTVYGEFLKTKIWLARQANGEDDE